MFEDSYLDSFMESHIGGWTGDEDRYHADDSSWVWTGDPNQDEDSLMEYADEQDDSEYDHWDDPDDHDIVAGYDPDEDPYAGGGEYPEDYCDHY